LRGAAFVHLDVREFMAEDAVITLAHRGQGEGVGGGAVKDKEHLAMSLENIPDQIGGLLSPTVLTVTGRMVLVRLGQGRPRFRTDPGVVVAGKMAARRQRRVHRRISYVMRVWV